MSATLFWNPNQHDVFRIFCTEARKQRQRSKLYAQLSENQKTSEYDVLPDEVLRHNVINISSVTIKEADCDLVVDCWTLLLHPQFSDFMNSLSQSIRKYKRVIFLVPNVHPEYYLIHPMMRSLSSDMKKIFEELLSRVQKIREFGFNAKIDVAVLESSPTLEFFEAFVGNKLTPQRKMNMFWIWPRECNKYSYNFSTSQIIAKELLQQLGFLGKSNGNEFVSVGSNQFVRERKTIATCRWQSFMDENSPLKTSLEHSICTRLDIVTWLFYLAVLEGEQKKYTAQLDAYSEKFFPTQILGK